MTVEYYIKETNKEELKLYDIELFKAITENPREIESIYQYSKILAIQNRLEELKEMLELMESVDSNYRDTRRAREKFKWIIENRAMSIYG